MRNFVNDPVKGVALFVNDFHASYGVALEKLSQQLGRPVRGVVLLDQEVKDLDLNTPDSEQLFDQIVCDYSSDASLAEALAPMRDQILLVMGSSERNQPYLQKLLPHLPYVNGPTESSLYWSTHKAKMREVLGSYDSTLVPKVQPIINDSEPEVKKVLSALCFPMIVKPTGLASSMLVAKANNESELRSIISNSFGVIRDIYARDRGRGEPGLICEEFIEGEMYSIDVYVNERGVVWHLPLLRSRTAYAVGLEGFYTYQTDSYHQLSDVQIHDGYQAATQAVHALGLRSCVAHIELFLTTSGWKIIELGPRAGGQRHDVYATAYGIDHTYNELLVKCGLEPELPTQSIAHSRTVNIYADQEGEILTIEGVEEARLNPSTFMLTQYAQPGDVALQSYNGGKIIIDGLMCNVDLDQLDIDTARVRSLIKITTR